MKNLRYGLLLASVSLALLAGCKRKEPDHIDLSSIHTTAAAETETMAAETSKALPEESETIKTSAAAESSAAETGPASNGNTGTTAVNSTKTRTAAYESGKVKIQYPVVYDTGNADKETAVNQLVKDNALSVIAAYELDESVDTVEVKCEVITADKKKLTVVYKGSISSPEAAHPANLFYSSTIDLNRVVNIGFSDYVDPYTMAGYVLSGDCQFPEASGTLLTELNKVKNETDVMVYTAMFEQADFPFENEFPTVFSYEKQGNIYFSIPVPHALGDYAIVKYTPDTK